MTKEALIAVQRAAWDAIAPSDGDPKELWHYPYRNVRWIDVPPLAGGFEICNVIGYQAQLEPLLAKFNPADVQWNFAFWQGPGFDDTEFWRPDPATLTADIGPPSAIGHRFIGQSDRIYAGDFDPDDFNEDLR